MTGCVEKVYRAQIFKAAEFSAAGLDSLGVAVVLIDGKTRQILYANGKFLAMTGFTIRQVIGQQCQQIFCQQTLRTCPADKPGQMIDNCRQLVRTASGTCQAVIKTIVPLLLEGEEYLLEIFFDASENGGAWGVEQESLQADAFFGEFMPVEEKLEALACFDAQTGLPNRLFFSRRIYESLWMAETAESVAVMFFFYLLDFGQGEVAEDEFLAVVYQRLAAAVKPAELVICRDGTKLFFFMENMNKNSINLLLDRIFAAFKTPVAVGGKRILVRAELGTGDQGS